MSDVVIYAEGPLTLSVCAPVAMDEASVTVAVNAQNECGTINGWVPSPDEWRRGGEPTGRHGPIPCDKDATRRHWLYTA